MHPKQNLHFPPSGLTSRTNGSQNPFAPSSEQIKVASLSILSTILKHNSWRWVEDLQNDQVHSLCQQLLAETEVLVRPELPDYTNLPSAFLSVTVLTLLLWRNDLDSSDYHRCVHETSLVENVVQFCLISPTETDGNALGPRWTRGDGTQQESSLSFALDLIYCWRLSGSQAWSIFGKLENRWRPTIEKFWLTLMTNQDIPDNLFPRIFLDVLLQQTILPRYSILSHAKTHGEG